ncbi:MAG: EAL domain-containing protein [Sulfuricella sp.]
MAVNDAALKPELPSLRVLIVEDLPSDAELMMLQLRGEGFRFEWQRVQTEEEYLAGLDLRPDLILADWHLPRFSGLRALQLLRERNLDIPFIIVSGGIGEEAAIDALRQGASDYVLKDRPARLGPAVRHALDEHQLRNARKQAEEALRLADRVFHSTGEGVAVTDAAGNLVSVNPAFELITGYSAAEVLGRNPRILQSGRHEDAFYREMWACLHDTGQWRGELWNRRKNGEVYPEWLTISAVKDNEGVTTHYVGVFSDISTVKEAMQQIDFLAHHDALTRLPNRILFHDRLSHGLDRAQRENSPLALLYLDLDRFKTVNDTLGHPVGDELLQEVARRMAGALRAGDTLARLGGDEFVLLLEDDANAQQAAVVARKILDLFAVPISVAEHKLNVTASIGISLYPGDGEDPDTLLRHADRAMYEAKSRGRNTYQFFEPVLSAGVLQRLVMENALRGAMERNELLLHYQPQVDLGSGRICAAEALLRWRSAELGLVAPSDFIPVAEEMGLIISIGEWVLRTACAQNKAWQDAGLPPIRVAVNVSALQVLAGTLPGIVADTLRDTGLDPRYLELELTESVMIREVEATLSQVVELKRLGVTISLDDFGTGYSSLGYLSRFPLDRLKIDQGFVRNITTEPKNAAIARATVALSQGLGMIVIAEGVETEGQLRYLHSIGCEEIQGYLFSRPVPPEELAAMVGQGKALSLDGALESERTLLLLDDEPNILNALVRLLRRDGYRIRVAHSGVEALELLAESPAQVVISDLRMPDMSGTDFLTRVSELHPDTVRMVLSGYADLQTVTDSVNKGAIYKFLAKPWADDALRATVRDAFVHFERELARRQIPQ